MMASEISQWENRIKAQGKTRSKKRKGLLPKKESSPDNKIRRTNDDAMFQSTPLIIQEATIGIIDQDSDLVKPKIDRSKLSNPTGSARKTKETKSVRSNKVIRQYIDVWNTSLFPKLREFKSAKDEEANKQTKGYQNVVRFIRKLIKGTLYDGSEPSVRFPANFQKGPLRIPLERFQYLVSNLEKMAFNSDYKPRNKTYLAKATLPLFLVGNGNYGSIPSLLLDRALSPAIPNTHTKPKDPKLAEVFRELFLFKTDRQEATLTFAERNHLVGASNKYLDFFTQFKEPFEIYGYKDPIDFLDEYYWKALNDCWPGRRIKKIPLGYLNSSTLIDRVIVPYFLKIGILKSFDFEGANKEYWR